MRLIYVTQFGDDSNGGLLADDALKTINKALEIAAPGDIIRVGYGVYPERLEFVTSGETQLIGDDQIIGDKISLIPINPTDKVVIGDDPDLPVIHNNGNPVSGYSFERIHFHGCLELYSCTNMEFSNTSIVGRNPFDLYECKNIKLTGFNLASSMFESAIESLASENVRIEQGSLYGSVVGQGITKFKDVTTHGDFISHIENIPIEECKLYLQNTAFPYCKNIPLDKTLVVASALFDTQQDIIDIDKSTVIASRIGGNNDVFSILSSTSSKMSNSIWYPLTSDIPWDQPLHMSFDYSLIKNLPTEAEQTAYDISFNHCLSNIDPIFTDPMNNDFSIVNDSPAVDAADPAYPVYEGYGLRADMGYYEVEKAHATVDVYGTFNPSIYTIKATDPVHHNVYNLPMSQLLANDIYLNNKLDGILSRLDAVADVESFQDQLTAIQNELYSHKLLNQTEFSNVWAAIDGLGDDYLKKTDIVASTIAASELDLSNIGMALNKNGTSNNPQIEVGDRLEVTGKVAGQDPVEDSDFVTRRYFLEKAFSIENVSEKTLYVNKTSGDDTNHGLSGTSPLRTLGKALSTANIFGKTNIIITDDSTQYDLDLPIVGANITIDANGAIINIAGGHEFRSASIDFRGCKVRINGIWEVQDSSIIFSEKNSDVEVTDPAYMIRCISSNLICMAGRVAVPGINNEIKASTAAGTTLVQLINSKGYLVDTNIKDTELGFDLLGSTLRFINPTYANVVTQYSVDGVSEVYSN